MDCATFERGLVALLDDADAGPGRDRALAELRDHARGCAACEGSSDLLEMLVGPAPERDPLPDPGPAYWGDFDRRLRERIAGEPNAVDGRPRRWGRGLAAIAAAAALALAALWLARSPGSAPAEVAQVLPGDEIAVAPLPEFLAVPLQRASPETLAEELHLWTDWDASGAFEDTPDSELDPGDDGDWFPDVEALSAGERKALMDWLVERSPQT